TPSWRRLNASFIMGTRSRFTTNPGDSLTSTASFPSFAQRSLISRTVSSEVSEPRITSTSFMTGAGLKKCMPTTRSARFVAVAIVHEALLDVPHRHLESGRGTRLRDPRPHGARADHGDPLDVT